MNFEELLESYDELFDSIDNEIDDFLIDSIDEEELASILEEYGINLEELDDFESIEDEEIKEDVRRKVTSTGNISRVKSRKTRSRRATITTGLSKSDLRRRAKKAARTRKKKPSTIRKALRKRNRAMRKRRQMNIRSGT